jgi:hypothetical protein
MSEFDGVSEEVGSRQTNPIRLFEGPRRAFDARRLVLDLLTCFTLSSELPHQNVCKMN